MDDLISRAAAIQIAERYGCNNGSALGHHSGAADCIASEIATLPAADAVPVIHARWILIQNGSGVCSACNRNDHIDSLAVYCRYCGAKMDGERRDDDGSTD